MDWDDVRYFLALARTGSLSAAARQLGVEHSTVARRAAQLEEALAVRLFDRLARGWALTAEGRALLPGAEAVEQEVLALRRVATGMDPMIGTVRLSAPPLILSHFLLPGLHALTAGHPGLTLDLVADRREADLLRAEADIAIRIGPPGAADLVMQSLGQIAYGFYGVAEEVERPAAEQAFIGFDSATPDVPQKRWLDEVAAGRRISLRTNDMAVMVQAAVDGFGITLLPEFVAARHPGLRRVAMDGPPLVRPVSLVMHPDVRRSRRVRLVVDRVVQVFRAALA